MDNKNLKKLLNKISPEDKLIPNINIGKRVLLIDGLNLFLRNFAAINYLSPKGEHIGGLGGFLRSLGFLINKIKPTSVYVIFDGVGSSMNRKNLFSEYKSGRGSHQITNWEAFNNVEEELDSKVGQISRLIHYLNCLPLKIISLDRVEADDVIAYLSTSLSYNKKDTYVYIVSSDKDFLQLASKNVIIYRPQEKEFWDNKTVMKRFNILPKNLVIYKTLIGDQSDKIPGIKGLGPKKIDKLFPELSSVELNMEDIYEISSQKYKDNVIYSKIVFDYNLLEKYYKIMDLSNPLLTDKDIIYLDDLMKEDVNKIDIESFIRMHTDDGLGRLLPNIKYWVKDSFEYLYNFNKSL